MLLSAPGWSAPDDAAALIRSADALLVARQFDRARALYERALAEGARFDNDLPHARNLAAAYLHSKPPHLSSAIRWQRIALTLDPTDDGLRGQHASALLRSGDLSGAIENYRLLADAHPQTAEYVIGLASSLRHAGQTDAAVRLLETSVESFPNLVPVRVEYGRLLNFTKQFSEAKRQFSAVLASDPQNVIAQVGMAKATSFAGDQESAIPMYDRILQRHSGLYDAIVGKAFALLWAGRPEQARPLLERARRIHPGDSEVREALSGLPAIPGSTEAGKTRAARLPATENLPAGAALATSPNPERAASVTQSSRSQAAFSEQRKYLSPSLIFLLVAALAAVVAGYGIFRMVWRSGRASKVPAAASQHRSLAIAPDFDHTVEAATAPLASQLPKRSLATHQPVHHPLPKSEALGENKPARPRLKAVLIGGPDSLLELELRWLPNFEVRREYRWEPALAALLNKPADLVVLNPMTHDAWTSSRMLSWIETNHPLLLNRTLAISSTGDYVGAALPGNWLFEPFNATDWRRAVVAVLQTSLDCPPTAKEQADGVLNRIVQTDGRSS